MIKETKIKCKTITELLKYHTIARYDIIDLFVKDETIKKNEDLYWHLPYMKEDDEGYTWFEYKNIHISKKRNHEDVYSIYFICTDNVTYETDEYNIKINYNEIETMYNIIINYDKKLRYDPDEIVKCCLSDGAGNITHEWKTLRKYLP